MQRRITLAVVSNLFMTSRCMFISFKQTFQFIYFVETEPQRNEAGKFYK